MSSPKKVEIVRLSEDELDLSKEYAMNELYQNLCYYIFSPLKKYLSRKYNGF